MPKCNKCGKETEGVSAWRVHKADGTQMPIPLCDECKGVKPEEWPDTLEEQPQKGYVRPEPEL